MTEPTHVLVVDDECDVRETLVEALTLVGYRVSEAANGEEALKYLKEHPTQLVLLDLMMPVMDGWHFRLEQQEDPALAAIPVVLLSAAVGLDRQADALKPEAFLPKPVDISRLHEVVARYCAR